LFGRLGDAIGLGHGDNDDAASEAERTKQRLDRAVQVYAAQKRDLAELRKRLNLPERWEKPSAAEEELEQKGSDDVKYIRLKDELWLCKTDCTERVKELRHENEILAEKLSEFQKKAEKGGLFTRIGKTVGIGKNEEGGAHDDDNEENAEVPVGSSDEKLKNAYEELAEAKGSLSSAKESIALLQKQKKEMIQKLNDKHGPTAAEKESLMQKVNHEKIVILELKLREAQQAAAEAKSKEGSGEKNQSGGLFGRLGDAIGLGHGDNDDAASEAERTKQRLDRAVQVYAAQKRDLAELRKRLNLPERWEKPSAAEEELEQKGSDDVKYIRLKDELWLCKTDCTERVKELRHENEILAEKLSEFQKKAEKGGLFTRIGKTVGIGKNEEGGAHDDDNEENAEVPVGSSDEKLKNAYEELAEAKGSLSSAKESIALLQKQKKEMIQKLNDKHGGGNTSIPAENKELQVKLEKASEREKELLQEKENLEAILATAHGEKGNGDTVEKLRAQLASANEAVDKITEGVKLREEAINRDLELKFAQQQEATKKELEDARKELEEARGDLARAEATQSRLQIALDESARGPDGGQSLSAVVEEQYRQEVEELRVKLEVARNEAKGSEVRINELNSRVSQLERELQTTTENFEKLVPSLKKSLEENLVLKKQIKTLKKEQKKEKRSKRDSATSNQTGASESTAATDAGVGIMQYVFGGGNDHQSEERPQSQQFVDAGDGDVGAAPAATSWFGGMFGGGDASENGGKYDDDSTVNNDDAQTVSTNETRAENGGGGVGIFGVFGY